MFRARDFDEYHEALAGHFVVLDVEERKQRILEGARTLCFARGLELVEDEGLLEEVAGLAEWPTPILGDMDGAFLDLPPEVIRTSMRTHQKYFAVRKPGQPGLAPHFLVVEGLPIAQPDVAEEMKGPRVGSPDQALDGFLRKTGLTREALVERDGLWFGVVRKTGRPTAEIIAELVEQIVRGFAWPKSMTWGTGKLRWVRPLQRILCVFNREIVPLEIDGIVAGDLSEGHRFMSETRVFRARDFDEYHEALAGHYVVLDVEERKARILEGARTLCFARGLELVEDEGLLEEVAGPAE